METVNYQMFANNKKILILVMIMILALGIIGQIGFLLTIFIFIILYWKKKISIQEIGLAKPSSWIKAIILGFTLAVVVIFLVRGVEFIIFGSFQEADISRFQIIKNNLLYLLLTLIFVWITAGFGEEIIWRGFMMRNIAILMGDSRFSWFLSLILTSVLFGSIHMYQGWIGIIQTGLAGLFLGVIFILNGKHNLWLNIYTHGFINTISLIYIYLN